MSFPLRPGATVSRTALHHLVGRRLQERITASVTTPNVLLFTNPGDRHSLYDGWSGTHFHFQAAGPGPDDQSLTRGNRAVFEHARTGRTLRLFSTLPGGLMRYLGAYDLDTDTPHVKVLLPVVGQPPHITRNGFVFRLRPQHGHTPTDVPAVEPLSNRPVIREKSLGNVFRPRLGEDPKRKLALIDTEAERLLQRYSIYLRTSGHDVRRYVVTLARELTALSVDLFDRTANEIIVCPGTVAKIHMWNAIGELTDLRRHFTPTPTSVVLLPAQPRPDLADLFASSSTAVVWPDGDTYRRIWPGNPA